MTWLLLGGSLVQMLEKCLPNLNTDWDKWRVYFCDERVVPLDSPDSTYGLYRRALDDKVQIKGDQYVPISPSLPGNPFVPPFFHIKVIKQYEGQSVVSRN